MNRPKQPHRGDHAADGGHMLDEADIGSGERTPGQRDTDEDIKGIPPLPHDSERDSNKRPPPP